MNIAFLFPPDRLCFKHKGSSLQHIGVLLPSLLLALLPAGTACGSDVRAALAACNPAASLRAANSAGLRDGRAGNGPSRCASLLEGAHFFPLALNTYHSCVLQGEAKLEGVLGEHSAKVILFNTLFPVFAFQLI